MARETHALDAFLGEADLAMGIDHRYDNAVGMMTKELADLSDIEHRARRVVEQMALVFQ